MNKSNYTILLINKKMTLKENLEQSNAIEPTKPINYAKLIEDFFRTSDYEKKCINPIVTDIYSENMIKFFPTLEVELRDLDFELIKLLRKNPMQFLEYFQEGLYHRLQFESDIRESVERFTEQIEVLTQTIDKLKSPNYGTIEYLEGSIVLNIYDFILKNPTIWKKDTRGISPQRKKHVKVRDKFRCQFCGELFKEEELVVDHIFPHSVGGSNEEYNLMALCNRCNDDKSASLKYYRTEEGRYKICDNIKEFVRTLPIIDDFGKWLKNFGDARRRKKKT